ncbi:MAG: YggT family protein [Pseudomonadota bacterium]
MCSLLDVLFIALRLYTYVIIASAVFSWLFAFNIVNPNNQFVRTVAEMLYRLTEPVLGPIRRMLPSLGGIDISPIVLLLGIFFIQSLLVRNVFIPMCA